MSDDRTSTVSNEAIIGGFVELKIMIQQTSQGDRFKRQLRDSLESVTLDTRPIKIARHQNVYTCGDQDEMVYFIASGQIKLLMLSPDGKECLLAIHSAGDIFGELCLSGSGARLETVTAPRPIIRPRLFAKLADRQIQSKRS